MLLNLIKYQQPDIDKIYLYVKDSFQSKHHIREKVRIKELKTPEAFIDYSKTNNDVYENIEDYNPTKKKKS